MSEGPPATVTGEAKVDIRLETSVRGNSDQVKSQHDDVHDAVLKVLVTGNLEVVREQSAKHTLKRSASDANLSTEEPRSLYTEASTGRDLKLAIEDSLHAAETLTRTANAARLLYEKLEEKLEETRNQCPPPIKVYAVKWCEISKYLPDMSEWDRGKLDHLYEEGEDINKQIIGLYTCRSDANNHVREVWENCDAKITDGDTFGEFLYSWWVDATEHEEGIRVTIEEMLVCGEGSVPPRKWTKLVKVDEGYDEYCERLEDEEDKSG